MPEEKEKFSKLGELYIATKGGGVKEVRQVPPGASPKGKGKEVNYLKLLRARSQELQEKGETGTALTTEAVFGKAAEEKIEIDDFIIFRQERQREEPEITIRIRDMPERQRKRARQVALESIREYARRAEDRWEKFGEEGYPGGVEETKFKNLLQNCGDPGLEGEYRARKELRISSLIFGNKTVTEIEALFKNQKLWELPLQTMGTILHRLEGVGEAIQLAEIEARIGREDETEEYRMGELGWLKDEREGIEKFTATTPRQERLKNERLKQVQARINEINEKRPQYQKARAELNQKLGQLSKVKKERAFRLAVQFREITGLRPRGDYTPPALTPDDPLVTKAYADRAAGLTFHNEGYLTAANPAHKNLVYFTPFVDLGYNHFFKETQASQLENFMLAADLFRPEEKSEYEFVKHEKDKEGRETKKFNPEKLDLALTNLAEFDERAWTEETYQEAWTEWLRKLCQANETRSEVFKVLSAEEITLEIVKRLKGYFGHLHEKDQKVYKRFFMSLATPSETARFNDGRAYGSAVVPTVGAALAEGAFSAEIWGAYLRPVGIERDLNEFVTIPPSAEETARVIINVLWGKNKELENLGLKPGDLLEALMRKFFKAESYPLSEALVAFAGLKVMEDGSLLEDKPKEDGRRWGDWLKNGPRESITRLLTKTEAGFFRIRGYFDIDRLVHSAIRAYLKADKRGDFLQFWTDFYWIYDNLTDLKGRRFYEGYPDRSQELDPLKSYFRGDGVDPLKDPKRHQARGYPIITNQDPVEGPIELAELRLLRGSPEWVNANAPPEDPSTVIMTPIDKWSFLEALGEKGFGLITGDILKEFKHRAEVWWRPRYWFMFKRWPGVGEKDAKEPAEYETKQGQAIEGAFKGVLDGIPGGRLVGKIVEYIPIVPTSLLDGGVVAMTLNFLVGYGVPWPVAYELGVIVARGWRNHGLSEVVRKVLRSPRCPAFLRVGDWPGNPIKEAEKVYKDYENISPKPR
jgi:hypothetical protein